jgi:acylphosphatase
MQSSGAIFKFSYFSIKYGAESMNVSYLARVSGKVQGVYFRASSQQIAIDHGLSGYARNLDDGDVEVLMCGEEKEVDKMLEWLSHGPPEAEVASMQKKQIQWQQHNFFSIS